MKWHTLAGCIGAGLCCYSQLIPFHSLLLGEPLSAIHYHEEYVPYWQWGLRLTMIWAVCAGMSRYRENRLKHPKYVTRDGG